MPRRDPRAARRALAEIAAAQGGYVTARQAASSGFGYDHLAYHVRVGNLVRVGHGLYHLPEIPASQHDQLIRLSLWSRDRADRPQAVASHATALFLHDLSDVLPNRVHLTVPKAFRKPVPRGCVLHRSTLEAREVEIWEGFAVTTPRRTLADVVDDDDVGREQFRRALDEALRRGLVRRSEVAGLMPARRPSTRVRQPDTSRTRSRR